MAITALILGIVGWVFCGPFTSIPGAIVAKMELGKIARGESPEAGKGLATAGFWISIINVVIYLLLCGVYCIIMVIGMAAGGTSGGYSY
jgi:hypothetical protein